MARRGTPWFHSRRRFCVPAAWDQPWANRLRRARPVVCRLAMQPPVFAREQRCVFPVGRCVDLVRRNRGRKELPCWFERRPCRPYYMHGVQAAKQLLKEAAETCLVRSLFSPHYSRVFVIPG